MRIVLLRAVNVGRHNRVKMSDLCRACEGLGFPGVRSYAQTGNLLIPALPAEGPGPGQTPTAETPASAREGPGGTASIGGQASARETPTAETPDRPGEELELVRRLEVGLARHLGINTRAILRSPAQLRQALAANPFQGPDFDPRKLLILFLVEPPSGTVDSPPGGERVALVGRELFAYYPDGMGRSKLTASRLERSLGVVGTGRNLASVQALLELAESSA